MIDRRTVYFRWSLLPLLLLLPGCSDSGTGKKMTLAINGKTYEAELIRTANAHKRFLSWNTLSGESTLVVRHNPPRHHFYDSHDNDFDMLFLDPDGKIQEIAHLEKGHETAVTSKLEAEWAVFLLPGTAEEQEMKTGDTVTFSEGLSGEKPELLASISINNHALRAEVARTEHERQHGLMHRKKFSAEDAMLFLHGKTSPEHYWMKNVHIDLDIAFFRKDRTLINVVEMKRYPDPKIDSGERARPNEPARYVVETNMGWFRTQGLIDAKGNPKGTVRLALPRGLD